nr:MAG TPA: hypothetical protein [Caudoviricetes sp.]
MLRHHSSTLGLFLELLPTLQESSSSSGNVKTLCF